MLNKTQQKGITLIELMIVVVIVSILVAIAYPSYQNHMRDTRRATAQADLMELAQFMERQYSLNNTYLDSDDDPPTLPFNISPRDGATAYNIALNATQNTFTLTATPTGPQNGDRCGNLTLDHTGDRSPTTDNCWR